MNKEAVQMFATPAEGILKDFVEFGDTGCADHEQSPPHQRTHAAEHYAKLINRNGRYRRFRHANSLPKRKPTVLEPDAPPRIRESLALQDGKSVELGRGAMGVTYKAVDVDLHCPVTLKVISERYLGDESARLRFLREARAAASVRHPNVASVLHLGRTGSSYFYAMEFVEGETLENLIKRSGRLEVKLALEIATQVAAP